MHGQTYDLQVNNPEIPLRVINLSEGKVLRDLGSCMHVKSKPACVLCPNVCSLVWWGAVGEWPGVDGKDSLFLLQTARGLSVRQEL